MDKSYSCAYSGFSTGGLFKIQRQKKKKTVIPVILNAALSDGLGVGGSAARHTSQGAFLVAEVQGSVK